MTLEEKNKDLKMKWFAFGVLFGLFFGFFLAIGLILEYPDIIQTTDDNDNGELNGVLTISPTEIGYYGDGIVDIHGIKVNCNGVTGVVPQQCRDIQYIKTEPPETEFKRVLQFELPDKTIFKLTLNQTDDSFYDLSASSVNYHGEMIMLKDLKLISNDIIEVEIEK
ncbi:MAG: hypothetical protein AABY07_08740 [Nanoarchaeota archaeon]